MSLNKFTDSTVEKKWMNIGCNDLKCETLETSGAVTFNGPFTITESTPSSIGGSPSTDMLVLRNSTNPTILRLNNPAGNSSLRISSSNPTASAVTADGSLDLTTASSSAVTIKPNNTTTATFTSTLTTLSTNVTIANAISVTSQPYLEVNIVAPLAIPSGSDTDVKFTTTSRTVGDITYNSGTGVVTVGTTGNYICAYVLDWDITASAANIGGYMSTGGIKYGSNATIIGAGAVTSVSSTGSSPIYLTASSTIKVVAHQSSGSALNLTGARFVVYRAS